MVKSALALSSEASLVFFHFLKTNAMTLSVFLISLRVISKYQYGLFVFHSEHILY